MAVAQSELMTAEEFWEQYAGKPYELINGIPVRKRMSPTGGSHQNIETAIAAHLFLWNQKTRAGVVLTGEGGFYIRNNPPTLYGIDVAFIRKENLPPDGIPESYWSQPPDLAVEVVSPYDRAAEIQAKIADYLEAGVSLVWVAYPNEKQIIVYKPDGTALLLKKSDTLTGNDVLPGFSVPVAELFPDAP